MRWPGHTIHFLRSGCGGYIRQVLDLADLTESGDLKRYASWTPIDYKTLWKINPEAAGRESVSGSG